MLSTGAWDSGADLTIGAGLLLHVTRAATSVRPASNANPFVNGSKYFIKV
jgi:hypothetical protein